MQQLVATSAKDRKAAERKRRTDAGFVLLHGQDIWVHEEDLERVKQYLQRLRDKHDKKGPP